MSQWWFAYCREHINRMGRVEGLIKLNCPPPGAAPLCRTLQATPRSCFYVCWWLLDVQVMLSSSSGAKTASLLHSFVDACCVASTKYLSFVSWW